MEGFDPGTILALANKGDGNKDNIMLFVVLLLFLGGKGGLGGLGGGDGEGLRSVATQNDVAQQTQFLAQGNQNLTDRISDARNSNDIHALTNMSAIKDAQSIGQAQFAALSKELCACCCENAVAIANTQRAVEVGQMGLQNSIDKCCCDTKNAICNQTNVLSPQAIALNQRVVDLLNEQTANELREKLHLCEDSLSNQRQTNELAALIRAQCGHGHHITCQCNGNGTTPPVV